MSTRNRNSFSGQAGRRAGGNTVRQAGAILFMGALSFVLGFFVLSRFVPTGHGPDSPSSPPPTGDSNDSSRSEQAAIAPGPASHDRNVAPTPRPSVPAANAPGPSIDPAPSIDPVEESETQKPASIDDSSDDRKDEKKDQQRSPDAEKLTADASKNALEGMQDNRDQTGNVRSARDGTAQTDATTPRHKRRKRRVRPTAPDAVADNKADNKPADATTTQRAGSLDDASGNKDEKTGSGDQGNDGNN